jgi:pimeloyl-ACP methyl ester carboxylesterase
VAELQSRGHDVVAPDLPSDDESAGLDEYTEAVLDVIRDRRDLTVVGQSLGGLVAPLVCDQAPASLLVMLAAMVPAPGETGGDWWANTGWEQARREQAEREGRSADAPFDPMIEFFHDVPPDVVAEAFARGERHQSGAVFDKPWPLDAWPDVTTRFLLCTEDRFFPAEFMRRVVRQRLGVTPDEMKSGHLPALSHPMELVERLEAYRTGG